MNEKQILDIIRHGLDGNTEIVAKIAAEAEKDLRAEAKVILAARIKEELDKERPISQFNKGWWNCFSSFAEEILCNGITGSDQKDSCIAVLKAAGITEEEAEAWLETDEANICQRTSEIVRQYWLSR